MKIIELRAERFKRLKAVEIKPDGNVVVLSGKNGQGKSSVLDSIWLALGGGAAAKDSGTVRPVHEGEQDAVVRLDLGDIIVTRRWTEAGGSTLTVESAEGRRIKSPQTLLDTLIGDVSFDPLSFSRMDPRDQRAQLMEIVKLPIDVDALDQESKEVYELRTDFNREVKSLEAELANMPAAAPGTPDAEIPVSQLAAQLTRMLEENARMNLDKRTLDDMRLKAETLKKQIEAMTKELNDMVERGRAMADKVAKQSFNDIEALKTKIANSEKVNEDVRRSKRRQDLKDILTDKRSRADNLTRRLAAIEAEKGKALQEAKFPIEGLSFDAEGITFHGMPFRQCSSAEQMKCCVAIAAALNPKIRVIRVADASLLDTESMEVVRSLAQEYDMQIWMERVSDGQKGVGVVIEDGTVAE